MGRLTPGQRADLVVFPQKTSATDPRTWFDSAATFVVVEGNVVVGASP